MAQIVQRHRSTMYMFLVILLNDTQFSKFEIQRLKNWFKALSWVGNGNPYVPVYKCNNVSLVRILEIFFKFFLLSHRHKSIFSSFKITYAMCNQLYRWNTNDIRSGNGSDNFWKIRLKRWSKKKRDSKFWCIIIFTS